VRATGRAVRAIETRTDEEVIAPKSYSVHSRRTMLDEIEAGKRLIAVVEQLGMA
jgi:hypothetical protein